MRLVSIKILLAVVALSTGALGKDYSLDEIVNLAQTKAVETKLAKNDLLKTEARIKAQKAGYYPKLKVVGGMEAAQAEGNEDVDGSNFLAEARLEYEVFNFGKTSTKIEALRELKQSKLDVYRLSKNELAREVKKDYYRALYFQKLVELFRAELKINERLEKEAGFRRKQSLVGEADVIEMSLRKSELKARLLSANEGLEYFKDMLRRRALLGPNEPVKLSGDLPEAKINPKGLKELREKGLFYNKELAGLKALARARELDTESVKARHLPSLTVMARYGKMRVDERYTPDEEAEGLAGIYLQIPLFDGGKSSAEVAAAKLEQEREKMKVQAAQRRLEVSLSRKLRKLRNAQAKVGFAKINIRKASKYYQEVEDEYKRGVKNSVGLASARDKFIKFKVELIKHKKDLLVSKIELEEMSGVSL